MLIDKKDFLTILILSTIFFSLAIWNLGLNQTPINTWKTTENKDFYIDFGEFERVNRIYFLVKIGSANVTIFTGSPENWKSVGILEIPQWHGFSYYHWNNLIINQETQYLRFNFKSTFIEVAELAVLKYDNQKINYDIKIEEGNDLNLSKIADEQILVECPPTHLSQTHFDEIYFVRTAEDYLNLKPPFSWSHPPLGKLIIASGISIFGYNPFGWRIMGVIFATSMISLVYLIGKLLFESWIGAFTTAFLFTFDFMNFSMGRMATTDVFLVFFTLASQLFFLFYIKKVLNTGWKNSILPLFFAVFFFGLGFSVKWIALFGFLGQLFFLFVLRLRYILNQKDGLKAKIILFFGRPIIFLFIFLLFTGCVYFLTYIPNIIAGQSLGDVFNLQGSMFSYHSSLISTHLFASKWWTWPFMMKPVLLLRLYLPDNFKSLIVAMGNPAVWWICIFFLTFSIKRVIRKKDFSAIFITILFFFQWLPYIFVSRTTYLYHFYSNVPLLCLATGYFLSKYWHNKWIKVGTIIYFSIVVIMFYIFYPIISGTPQPTSFFDNLKWFESWSYY